MKDDQGLLDHHPGREEAAAGEASSTERGIGHDVRSGNAERASRLGDRANDTEDGAIPDVLAEQSFDFLGLDGAVPVRFGDQDGFIHLQFARGVPVAVGVVADEGVDHVVPGVGHRGFLHGDWSGGAVVGGLESACGAASREAQGHTSASDSEGHPSHDVHGHWGKLLKPRQHTIAMKRTFWGDYRHNRNICQ